MKKKRPRFTAAAQASVMPAVAVVMPVFMQVQATLFMNKVVTSSAPGRITPFSGLGSAMMVTANSANPSPGPVSLLDLEAAHKKKKERK